MSSYPWTFSSFELDRDEFMVIFKPTGNDAEWENNITLSKDEFTVRFKPTRNDKVKWTHLVAG